MSLLSFCKVLITLSNGRLIKTVFKNIYHSSLDKENISNDQMIDRLIDRLIIMISEKINHISLNIFQGAL